MLKIFVPIIHANITCNFDNRIMHMQRIDLISWCKNGIFYDQIFSQSTEKKALSEMDLKWADRFFRHVCTSV